MNSNKRSRGRPVGTGLDDGPTLKKGSLHESAFYVR